MSDENVGGLVELPKPIRAMVRFTALQHIECDVYTAEQLHAYADARVEAALSAHGQPEPRVSQAMLDSQLEIARLLDDLEKRSEARREKYGLHGQPVVDEAIRLLRAYRNAPKFSNDHAAMKRVVSLEDEIDTFLYATPMTGALGATP